LPSLHLFTAFGQGKNVWFGMRWGALTSMATSNVGVVPSPSRGSPKKALQSSHEKHGIWYSSTGFQRELELIASREVFFFFSLCQRAADTWLRKFIIPLLLRCKETEPPQCTP
jgi:hypothetical protein